MMTDKNMEMMRKLIEAKKQKSAQQGGPGGGNQGFGRKMGGKGTSVKKYKKGGLFDK